MKEAKEKKMPVFTVHSEGQARSRSADIDVGTMNACGRWLHMLQRFAVKAMERSRLDDEALADIGGS